MGFFTNMFASAQELDLIMPLNCGQKLFCGQTWKGCAHTPLWLQLSRVESVYMGICCYIFQDGFLPLKTSDSDSSEAHDVNIPVKGFREEERFLGLCFCGCCSSKKFWWKSLQYWCDCSYGNTKTYSNILVNSASDFQTLTEKSHEIHMGIIIIIIYI